jgi:hypothetical protein
MLWVIIIGYQYIFIPHNQEPLLDARLHPMKSLEENTHSFIVRVWRERREREGAAPEWRGVIEHVQGGKLQYLRNLEGIIDFIEPYLSRKGPKESAGH